MRFVGIDWAQEEHVVVVIDQAGVVLGRRSIQHRAADLAAMVAWLDEIAPMSQGRVVGMESGAGLICEYLLDRAEPVYVFNPKVVDRYRDRFSPAGSKDDHRDAEVIAGILRTDRNRFRPFEPDSELTTEMRLRVRGRLRLVERRVALMNELGDALRNYYPATVGLAAHGNDAWFLEFLRRFPDPQAGATAKPAVLARLLRQHGVRKWTTARLVEHLRREVMPVRDAIVRGQRANVLALVEQLQVLNAQIARADEDIAGLLKLHPDRDLILSLTGVRTTLAARMLAEIGDDRARLRDHSTLQVRAGTAPVTKQSGKGRVQVSMRRSCNRQLQDAFFQQARTSRARSSWAQAFYAQQRRAGRSHATATRNLSNKWAKIVATLLVRREKYDEPRHLRHLEENRVPWWTQRAA